MKWVLYVWMMQGSAMGLTTHTGFSTEDKCMQQAEIIQQAKLAREVRTICLPDLAQISSALQSSIIPQMERELLPVMERLARDIETQLELNK